MVEDDADRASVERLLVEILESGDSPEEACRACPELLSEVRAGLRQLRLLDDEVRALFPPSSDSDLAAPGFLVPEELPVVPGYEVLGVLGRGGMGIVFRARHLRLNRQVAMKMILAGPMALPAQRVRFLREAEAIAALSHPNIVQVCNAGESSNRPWFTMELVEGGSLARRICGKPQPIRESASLMASVTEAVAVAHRQGIVHRDLKPGNILLTTEGVPKVTDFGLARWADEDGMTLTGSLVGTASYMSPEQARGASREISPATDVYALGAILYELLTGRPPFRGETSAATLHQVLMNPVPPPKRLNPRVPRDLETICLKCLDKDPTRRYPTAKELAEDLSRFLKDKPIRARSVGRVERCIRWGRRQPAHAALVMGTILVAAAVALGSLELHAQRQAMVRDVQTDLTTAERLTQSSAWAEAIVALDRAHVRLGNGGPQDLRRRIDQTRNKIAEARRRLELIQRVEQIRLTRVTCVEGRYNPEAERRFRDAKADQAYAGAFAAAGTRAADEDAAAAASRMANYHAGLELIAALDDWRLCAADRRRRDWLADVLRRLDPDPWRGRVRDPAVWEDESALRSVAQSAPVAEQQVDFLITLAERLGQVSKDGREFLRRVQTGHPAEFWANLALGNMLLPDDAQDAVAYYRRAVAIRPGSTAALNNLGLAQSAVYVIPDATQTFRDALQQKPNDAAALNNFGLMWKISGNYPEAEAYLRDAVKLDPDSAEARVNLAEIVALSGGPGVVELLRRAVAIDPRFARAHYLLGLALCARTPIDEATAIVAGRDVRHWGTIVVDPIAYYHSASDFDPAWIPVTQDRARLTDAIGEYRLALTCDPLLPQAYAALAQALLNQGEMDAALNASRRAFELQDDPQVYRLTDQERAGLMDQLRHCQRDIELAAHLPSVLDGSTEPADADEFLESAELCVAMDLHEPAARLYLRAFTADPTLAEDQKAGHCYRAACAAALAGADAEAEQGQRWRSQSRAWLEAEMEQYFKRLEVPNREDSVRIYFNLSHWLTDPALASIRGEAQLTRISRGEAEECRHLWANVRTCRQRAEENVDR